MKGRLVHMSSKMDSLLDEDWSEVVKVPYEKKQKFDLILEDICFLVKVIDCVNTNELVNSVNSNQDFFTVYGSNYNHDLAYHLIPKNAEALVVFDAHNDCCDSWGTVDSEGPTFTDWIAHATRKVGQVFGYGLMPEKENLEARDRGGRVSRIEDFYDNLELLTFNEPFTQILDKIRGKRVHVSVDLDVCSKKTDHPLAFRDKILSFEKLKQCSQKILDNCELISMDVCGVPFFEGYKADPETFKPVTRKDYFNPEETIGMIQELKELVEA